MTRLPAAHWLPPNPASVTLAELAIAAGVAEHSITICYRDYAAPLLCEQWKYLAQSVDAAAVYHVHGQADVRRITERIGALRLIFVHSPSHHHATAWTVQMAGLDGEAPHPRPTIFSHGSAVDIDEDPGATLLLRCDMEERHALTQWLIAGNRHAAGWANAAQVIPVDVASTFLGEATPPDDSNQRGLGRFRERTVLRGLLAGGRLLRWPPEDDPNNGALNVPGIMCVRRWT